ncbi:unnamed protein product, partial [Nesidiocoris tenuis]
SKWKYWNRPKFENRNGASETTFFLIHIYSESLPEQESVCPPTIPICTRGRPRQPRGRLRRHSRPSLITRIMTGHGIDGCESNKNQRGEDSNHILKLRKPVLNWEGDDPDRDRRLDQRQRTRPCKRGSRVNDWRFLSRCHPEHTGRTKQ